MDNLIYTKEHKYVISQLKKARLEAGLDQSDVAKILKRQQPFVSRIELGQRKVDVVLLQKLAKIYKKPVDYFLSK